MPRTSPLNDRPIYRPLKNEVYWILLSLVDRPLHGYGILLWIRERSEDSVKVGTGQLYRHLQRLLEDDWLEPVEAPEEDRSRDERRQYYRLRDEGRRRVEAESRRLSSLVRLSRGLGLLPEQRG